MGEFVPVMVGRKIEELVRDSYRRWIRPHVQSELSFQRIKMLWFVWGYWRLLQLKNLSIATRLSIVFRFVRIDFRILHSHRPCEIVTVCKALTDRIQPRGEVMIEAGAWKGGSSAKFSIVCKKLNLELWIYDSFQGVESVEEDGYDFSGEYVASEAELLENVKRYGEIQVCRVFSGWFSDTMARDKISRPVALVYIDCDLAQGTFEVLRGVLPNLTKDGWIFSQDYHIQPVRLLLHNKSTWDRLGVSMPIIRQLCGNLARLQFSEKPSLVCA